MSKIPVYLMPGLAASSTIFEHIKLPVEKFEIFYLEWFLPLNKESIEAYAFRMTKKIKHKNPVLIGVSFGGIIVQEMALLIETRKVIIISSVKSNAELPLRMKIAKSTKAYKVIPTQLVSNIDALAKYAFGENLVTRRLRMYEKYLQMRDKKYLDWAIENVILWRRTKPDENVIHIHGDADAVFPIRHIKNSIVVKGATHILVIMKYKWLNENLPKLILNNDEDETEI
ncbi:alpha/beta hydrolase [Flavobacterium gelidilacus]|uniref:alpha/beta hydrolase n=1 Tax=Flavobacterium gelidilacus TaxID=206041 RepID=UPI000478FA19|nr:alpha/beta hydrolase [Flavobacterium gelidilacus]